MKYGDDTLTKILSLILILLMSVQIKPTSSISALKIPKSESVIWGQSVSSERYRTKTEAEAEAFRSMLCALELEKAESGKELNSLYSIELIFSSSEGTSFRFSIDPSGLVWLNGEIEELYRVVNRENLYQELFDLTPLALDP